MDYKDISKYKDDFFFVFLYFPSFMHLLWNQTKMFLLEMLLRLSSPNHSFQSTFRPIHFSETRGRDSRTILSGYFYYVDN